MNKLLLTLSGLFLISGTTVAQQQIDNSGFENWDNVGSSNEEPTEWNSFETASGGLSFFSSQQVEQSTDAHSGNFSCRIFSESNLGIIANGNVTVGQVNMGSTTPTNASNYNITRTNNPDFHQVLTDEPDSLVFWAKFTPVDGNDFARVSATIHDNYDYRDPEDAGSSAEIYAKADSNYATTNGQWQRFSVPFDYASYTANNASAQYILITFTTNETPGGGTANDEVLVDDVELIYNIPQVDITPSAAQNILVSTPGNQLTANESPVAGTSREWKYTTTSGSGYQSFSPQETGTTYTPQFANPGTYYVIVESVIQGSTVISNEVVINVADQPEVTVTPNTAQNILVNTDGTDLNANETPAGSSREWKYSTTSGSGYQSFAPQETGLTYTPNFASAGTYYIVVESVINSNTYTSNEVTVNVSEASSTVEGKEAQIKVFHYQQQLFIDYGNVDASNAQLELYNTAGQLVKTEALNGESKVDVSGLKGIHIYRLSTKEHTFKGKLNLQ